MFCDKHTTWRESPYRFVPAVVHEASGLPMPVAMNVMNYLVKPGRDYWFTEDVYDSDTEPEEEKHEDEEEYDEKKWRREQEEEEKDKARYKNEGYWQWRKRKNMG